MIRHHLQTPESVALIALPVSLAIYWRIKLRQDKNVRQQTTKVEKGRVCVCL